MDRLKRFFSSNKKPITAHEEFEMKEMGKSANTDGSSKGINADKTGITSTRSVTKAPEKTSWFARLRNIRFGRGKSLSKFNTSKVSARDKAINTTIKAASKEHQQIAKEYLQKQGYKGSELSKIMNNLENIPDEHYIEAVEDIPQKKFHDLGYTSQRVAIGDFDEAFAALLGADFSTKDAEIAILHAKENANKNNFRKSFKEKIKSRVDDVNDSSDKLSEAEVNKQYILKWAMDKLADKDVFGSRDETLEVLQDMYLGLLNEYPQKNNIFINSKFMEKFNEFIETPDYEQTEVKRLF